MDQNDATQEQDTQEHKAPVQANFNKNVDMRTFKFNFKKDDLGNKRASVELQLPVPSVEGIIAILEAGGKGLEYLQDVVADAIASQARSLVNEREDVNQASFPMNQVSWDFIANMPKAERRGGGIPKEVWEAFALDYIAIMPAITGKATEAVTNAAKILVNKFAAVKTNKPILRLLKDQLGLYISSSPNVESFTECVEFLLDKSEALLNLTDEDLTKNL